ncbi:tyrosine-type recombinase/integrase [Blastococcus sp. CT_GayMR20]|uniref:tyrosine-type recombinase/integrase n=1 Tax=Blastococcus sp. CT_GayMR20 TaxID=2559609 RepID=UPI00143083BB|nr:tyrosine-type recombinase/integrase [Blastococcus sp. CT_GayMR20]
MSALRLVTAGQNDGSGGSLDPDIAAFTHWQTELRGLRPNTVRVRADVLGRLSLWLGKPLREASEADLLRWEQAAVAGRAAETRRAYVSHVKAFYRWAVLAGIVAADPSSRLTNPKLSRPLPRPVPEDVLRQAVAAAKPKMRLMILLGAFCGLRTQEIAGLHWTDLGSADGQTSLLVREGKGGKERVVPVPGPVLEAMIAYGRRRSGPMFYGMDAAQISAKSVSCAVNRFTRRHGLDFTAHQLRHRYGTTAYQLTKDLRMVQELLGHGSPQTTARYAAYDTTQTVDMVQAMTDAWTGAGDGSSDLSEAELAEVSDALGPVETDVDDGALDDEYFRTAPQRRRPEPPSAEPRPAVASVTPEPPALEEAGYAHRLLQAEELLRQAGFVQGRDGWHQASEPAAAADRPVTVNDLGLLRPRRQR